MRFLAFPIKKLSNITLIKSPGGDEKNETFLVSFDSIHEEQLEILIWTDHFRALPLERFFDER